jgi:hypothetical protein
VGQQWGRSCVVGRQFFESSVVDSRKNSDIL